MSKAKGDALADRLKAAADARLALLAKFRPKPAIEDPLFDQRAALQAAELKDVRAERGKARAAVRKVASEAAAGVAASAEARARPKRSKTPAEAKDQRDARYAARKSRQ